jgi:phosphatidate cytidylyltransferase
VPEPAPSAASSSSRLTAFAKRLGSSVLLWSVVVAALFAPNPILAKASFVAAMMLLAGAGLVEFYGLVERRGLVCFKYWGLLAGLLMMGSTFLYLSEAVLPQRLPSKANDFETGILVVFVLGLCLRQFVSQSNPAGLLAISTTLFGLMYVPWLLNFVQKIHFCPGVDGRLYLVYFLVVTKFSDMGAYAVGSLIGRHKMIPRISPGKTWEGFGGALAFSVGASVAIATLAGERLTGMRTVHAVVLGFVLAVGAVVGDLIESLFKRETGVKDSGRLFPGIGGFLDLLDSILFNAPLMYLYLRHVLTRP